MTNLRIALLIGLSLFGLFVVLQGCNDRSTRTTTEGSSILSDDEEKTSRVLIDSISRTLNNLPQEVVTILTPPKVILDASRSADGQEVQALLTTTPGVPDSPFNYLFVPEGNANFRTIGIEAGDVVRYYVKYDQDDLEHGFENISYYELVVRRLDTNNMQNALVVEGGLTGEVEIPHRIEVWRFSDRRMREILNRLNRYLEEPKVMLGWEPSPDESALVQLVDRLNQWWRNLADSSDSWQLEPMVKQLPKDILADEFVAALLSDTGLTDGGFELWETRLLQQAVWLRDISAWAKGDALKDLAVANALFDWTIRNIQLDGEGADAIVHHPWQALMFGHGSAEDRAWVFAELCRHQQLDVVMLAVEKQSGEPQWWLPALLADGELHLFDARLGMPLPGSESESIATLSEVLASPELLDKLTIDGAEPYPLSAADFEEESTRIVASPIASHLQLARRSTELQEQLEAEEYISLAANTGQLAERLKELTTVDTVALWPYPFSSLLQELNLTRDDRLQVVQRFLVLAQRPKLWKARVLHFQGTKDIPLSERDDPLAQANLGHRSATQLYQGSRISDRVLRSLESEKRVIYRLAKIDASYWLALLKSAQGNHEVAKHWLETQTIKATPNGPWTAGARYNLARTYEALGEFGKAIELLEADGSPQRLGNLLRARMLREKQDGGADTALPAEAESAD